MHLAQVTTHGAWREGWTPPIGMGEQGTKALRDALHLFEKDIPPPKKRKKQEKIRQNFAAYTNSMRNINCSTLAYLQIH